MSSEKSHHLAAKFAREGQLISPFTNLSLDGILIDKSVLLGFYPVVSIDLFLVSFVPFLYSGVY